MGTGACGINCDVCWLKVAGICSTCGHGKSPEAKRKLNAQIRIFGAPCQVLNCAVNKELQYCMRDCRSFPCEVFSKNRYPFSEGFLNMQMRRKREYPPSIGPSGNPIVIPESYWDELKAMDVESVCSRALVRAHERKGYMVPFLSDYLRVDTDEKAIFRMEGNEWERVHYPMLELIMLVYLLYSKDEPLSHNLITVKEMKDGHFFQGPHELKIKPVLERFGYDLEGFKRASRLLGGKEVDMADASFILQAFPRIPVYYLLWKGDDEFPPRVSVLFDSSIEKHFKADAVWGLVNVITDMLIRAESEKGYNDKVRVSH